MKGGLLVGRLAELFKDFSQVYDVFLDNASSLRFAGLFAQGKLLSVGSQSSLFGSVITHLALARVGPDTVSLRD